MTTTSSTYTVRATRWRHGWELAVKDVGHTQSRTLAEAEQMVRDYVATVYDLTDAEADALTISVVPDLGKDINRQVAEARQLAHKADAARCDAARASRSVVVSLRKAGMSGAEIARVLHLSPQRVSQLLKSAA